MTRSIRLAVALLCVASSISIVGCASKDESKPNSELTIPDVPAAGSAAGKKGPGGPKMQ